MPVSSKYDATSKSHFYKSEIDDKLYGISSLSSEERSLVKEELLKEYGDDSKLERREVVQAVRRLYRSKKISEHDMEAIFKKFGIGRHEVKKYSRY